MGIGGAVLYSLAFMGVRGLLRFGALAARWLHWLGRTFLDGAAQQRANLGGGQLFHDPLWGGLQQCRAGWPEHNDATGG